MADKGVRIGITASDQTKAGIDSAKQSVEGLNAKMKDLSKGMEGVNKLASLMAGAGALAGVTMALRKVYQGAADCEAAFAKMYPESQKSEGSLAKFSEASDRLKASIGRALAEALTPFRAWFVNLMAPANAVTMSLDDVAKSLEEVTKRFGTDDQKRSLQALIDKADATKKLAEFTKDYNAAARVQASQWKDFVALEAKLSAGGFSTKMSDDELLAKALEFRTMSMYRGSSPDRAKQEELGKQVIEYTEMRFAYNNNTEYLDKLREGMALLREALDRYASAGFATSRVDLGAIASQETWMSLPDYTVQAVASDVGTTILEMLNGGLGPTVYEPAGMMEMAGGQGPYQGTGGFGPNMGNPFIDFLSGLATRFGRLVTSPASVQSIMDPFGVILQAMVATLQPTIDALIMPLIGMLSVIGQLLGKLLIPVLNALAPIIKAIGEVFVWLYNNIIIPVGNVIWAMFQSLANGIDNFVVGLENFFNGKGLVWGTKATSFTYADAAAASGLTPISVADLATTGTQYQAGAGGTSTSGGTATYQAKTINVVVNAAGAFISDLRDFALLIRNEITSAEALGY